MLKTEFLPFFSPAWNQFHPAFFKKANIRAPGTQTFLTSIPIWWVETALYADWEKTLLSVGIFLNPRYVRASHATEQNWCIDYQTNNSINISPMVDIMENLFFLVVATILLAVSFYFLISYLKGSIRWTHIDAFFRRATGSAYDWSPSDDGWFILLHKDDRQAGTGSGLWSTESVSTPRCLTVTVLYHWRWQFNHLKFKIIWKWSAGFCG